MDKNKLYETIFKRKSIRNYDITSLDESTLNDISNHLDNLEPLYDDIKTELKIISGNYVKKRMMKKAPHYIAIFSEVKEGYLTNVGFMLQQMDLLLSANGIGTCWQGIPKPKKEILTSSDLKFIILIAFGKPDEPLYRNSVSEFKRKPLKDINNFNGSKELLEAVRLAPSATNSQPWFLKGDDNLIHIYAIKPNFVRGLVAKKWIPIDVGIALYHLKLAGEHFCKKTEIFIDKTNNNLDGFEYIASMNLF